MAKKIENTVEEEVVATVIPKKVSVKSVYEGTLIHSGIEINAFEVISVNEEIANELVATGYCQLVKVKEV